ncbi:unnamed protein product [Clavelina lepadiformis]|uniref:Uncharacterized protein n=1 Tax=Clavelina lepadiformis TaxID=159417 RepID=A0ABP0G9I8_CLALP
MKSMPSIEKINSTIQSLFGCGFAGWILLTVALFAPEWTRDGDKHCGVIFCCLNLYGNCTITETAVVASEFSYIFSSWLLSFVAIFSSACRCIEVKVENIRQMAVLLVIAGVLAVTGSIEFFIQKFTNDDLNFSAGGFVAHAAGWMLLISGCCGYCFGYGYRDHLGSPRAPYPSRYRRNPWGLQEFSRYGPMNFARMKWREFQNTKTGPMSMAT